MTKIDVRVMTAAEAETQRDALSDVLADCVHNGASVNFMLPFPKAEADAFWRNTIAAVAAGKTVLLGAFVDGRLLGTAQLGLDSPPNQPHRADVKKMLVHSAARNRGVGAALMAALEAEARARNITLLTLDTASDVAERLYERAGFIRAGVIPGYALWPQGGLCDTVLYYKPLI